MSRARRGSAQQVAGGRGFLRNAAHVAEQLRCVAGDRPLLGAPVGCQTPEKDCNCNALHLGGRCVALLALLRWAVGSRRPTGNTSHIGPFSFYPGVKIQ